MNEESRANAEDDEPLTPQQIRKVMKQMLAGCAPMRRQLYEGRKLCGHLQNPPNFDLHLKRLREIETLLQRRRIEDWPRIKDLEITFRLDHEADIAASRAEVAARLIQSSDWLLQRAEERKFAMTPEQRDGFEELMMPYVDKHRENILGELPIAVRRELEANKRKLAEEGTE